MLLVLPVLLLLSSSEPLREALELFNSGKYQESFELAAQYLRQHAESPTAYKLLGMDQFMLGHPHEALASVTHATELAPRDADAIYYLGRLYFSANNFSAARNSFLRTIVLDPASVRAHNYLGQTYEALGQRKDAEKSYLTAMELGKSAAKKSEWPAYNLGVLYLDDGRTADSIACFRAALESNPAFPDAKIKLAVALSKSQPVAEAFVLLRQALAIDPQNAEGHYRLALLLTKSGKHEQAQQEFQLFERYRKP